MSNYDFAGFTASENFALAPDEEAVMNVRYPLLHLHDFPNPKHESGWREHIPQVVSKYQHIVGTWRNVTSDPTNRILFVRQQGHFDPVTFKGTAMLSDGECVALCSVLNIIRGGRDWQLLLVNATEEGRLSAFDDQVSIKWISWDAQEDWPDPADRWRGNTRDWKEVLMNICPSN